MPAPSNRQEFPDPHRDWRGADQVDAAPSRSLSKVARLWSPIRAILETPAATLARVAHRLVDRTTGIPYSADELQAKILALTGSGTVESLTTSDGSADAAAGKLGEYLSDEFGPIGSLTTGTPANLGSKALTAGLWEVRGIALFVFSGADITTRTAGLSTTSATLEAAGEDIINSIPQSGVTGSSGEPVFTRRFRLTSTTTIYLVAEAEFSAGTVQAGGKLTAIRIG